MNREDIGRSAQDSGFRIQNPKLSAISLEGKAEEAVSFQKLSPDRCFLIATEIWLLKASDPDY
jgi:hypothetical protein